MSSHDVLGVMRPGGRLVVEGACLEAAVQDSDQPVGPLPQGGVMSGRLHTALHCVSGVILCFIGRLAVLGCGILGPAHDSDTDGGDKAVKSWREEHVR